MKTRILLTISLVAALFMGCEDDTADIIINDNSVTNNNTGGSSGNDVVNLSGVYTENLTLETGTEYLVTGPVLMASGTTLTIPAGMTIRVQPVGVNAYIAIQQGARIVANGTASSPIVITSNSATPGTGDWGGLIICGNANTNLTADNSTDTATTEVGGLSYGGGNANDDSGSISYMRLEYTGGAINGNAELNGLSLYAVGDQTSIEYIQIYQGSDDGVEFFGGTVNVSYVSVVGSEDDSIDWTEGYTGTLTDVYIEQTIDGDSGFEMDGFNTDFSNESESGIVSLPTVNNVTFIGSGDNSRAFRVRAGTGGIFTNISISDTGRGVVVEDDNMDWVTSDNIPMGLNFTDVVFSNVATEFSYSGSATPAPTQADVIGGSAAAATGTDYATWGAGWTRQ